MERGKDWEKKREQGPDDIIWAAESGPLKLGEPMELQVGEPTYSPCITCLSWVPVIWTLKSPEGHRVKFSSAGGAMRWRRLEQ